MADPAYRSLPLRDAETRNRRFWLGCHRAGEIGSIELTTELLDMVTMTICDDDSIQYT